MNTEYARYIGRRLQQLRQRLHNGMEDFKNKNQWLVDAYWEWYYKANDVYQKFMSYPEVQEAKAIAAEMIKTVTNQLWIFLKTESNFNLL